MATTFAFLYFTAYTITVAETKQSAEFFDYISVLGLLIIYPIGIWYIQPQINKIIEDGKNNI